LLKKEMHNSKKGYKRKINSYEHDYQKEFKDIEKNCNADRRKRLKGI
jgi:hypothetical protein